MFFRVKRWRCPQAVDKIRALGSDRDRQWLELAMRFG
jgi:hypothetical protein